MSHPFSSGENADPRTTTWPDNASDATQVVRPAATGDEGSSSNADPIDSPPNAAPSGAAPVAFPPGNDEDRMYSRRDDGQDGPENDRQVRAEPRTYAPVPPVGAPLTGQGRDAADTWSPAASPHRQNPQPEPNPTAVYAPSPAEFAPVGHPPDNTPRSTEQSPPIAIVPAKPASRVLPALLSVLIGLLLSAGGFYLAVKFGIDFTGPRVGVRNSVLALLGALLILAAVVLNGWSPWSTIIPGIALTGLGGWALFDTAASRRITGWVPSMLSSNSLSLSLSFWLVSGFALILGLAMLGASAAAIMARASGKRDGAIIGRNRAERPAEA